MKIAEIGMKGYIVELCPHTAAWILAFQLKSEAPRPMQRGSTVA